METAPDPARQKVERADAVLREMMEPVIDDPTVFVKGAALGALTLLALCKLAQSKATDGALRDFAQRVRRSEEGLRRELQATAGRERLDVPSALIYDDEQMLKEGAAKSGPEFDAWWTQQTAIEHQKAVALFEAATRMKDAALAALAKKQLPVLEADRKASMALLRN